MGLPLENCFKKISEKTDKKRVGRAQHAAKSATKEARLKRKHAELVKEDIIARREGPMHGVSIAPLPEETETSKKAEQTTKKSKQKKWLHANALWAQIIN